MFKFKCILTSIFLMTLIGVNEVSGLISYDLSNKIIYIDAGHGGIDPGATYKELRESDINLNFSKILGDKLEQLGAIVLYIRDGDYDLSSTKNGRKKSDLSNRVNIINDSTADIYISIHVNSIKSSNWHGAQVFYNEKNKNNKILAENIYKSLKNNNISKRKLSEIKNIYMYDRIEIPGILIELGFISNYTDRIKLTNTEYIDKFTNLVIKGIVKYFDNI